MGYISTEEVAEKRKKLKEAFPDYKFSISKDGYSGIRVAILEGTIPLLEEGENYRDVNVYYIDESFKDMPQARDVINKIYNIINEGNKRRETSDYGTQPDFYTYIYIGQSDNKPYKVIPKKSSGRSTKKGFRKFGEKKTEGFEFVESCLNGWKLFVKQVENSSKPYNYRFIKDYEVKPVGKEQFYALKGDMLETGFLWSVKAQCFEMFSSTSITAEQFSDACGVLRKYFPMTEESKKEEATPPPTPPTSTTTTTKVPIKSISLPFEYAKYSSFKELDDYFKFLYEDESKLPTEVYDKYKIEFEWVDGSRMVDRLDISKNKGDYNPFEQSLNDYYQSRIALGKTEGFYDSDMNTNISNLAFEDLEATQTEEVNLEQLISDINILVELETDNDKKMELAGYRNDLQILLSLNN